MLAAGRHLSELHGIGKDLAGKIKEIVETGHLTLLKEIERRVPEGLLELLTLAARRGRLRLRTGAAGLAAPPVSPRPARPASGAVARSSTGVAEALVQAAATALTAGIIGGLLGVGLVVGGVAMPSTVLALTVTVALVPMMGVWIDDRRGRGYRGLAAGLIAAVPMAAIFPELCEGPHGCRLRSRSDSRRRSSRWFRASPSATLAQVRDEAARVVARRQARGRRCGRHRPAAGVPGRGRGLARPSADGPRPASGRRSPTPCWSPSTKIRQSIAEAMERVRPDAPPGSRLDPAPAGAHPHPRRSHTVNMRQEMPMTDEQIRSDTDEVERWAVLYQLEEWLEIPMLVLSFAWFVLVLAELTWEQARLFGVFGTIIWILFIADFLLRFVIAPRKLVFLRRNTITIAALVLPALRMFRVLQLMRVARVARGLTLVRIVGTANRTMNALKRSLGRRGLGYVLLVTLLVALLGAGGMLAFEPAAEVEGGFAGYADALWWTAMLLTTMGSGFWPLTAEGRVLALLLSVYGFAVFGYITASFATFFIGQEAQDKEGEVVGVGDITSLREEIALLRAELSGRAS